MTDRLLTTSQAAERLGVTPQRVRALAQAGELAARRAEGVWLIDADSVAQRVLLGELDVAASAARPWSQAIAWAAMRALDDDEVLISDLDRKSRYRVHRRWTTRIRRGGSRRSATGRVWSAPASTVARGPPA